MPPVTSKPAPKRKAPTFKPPRPNPKSTKTSVPRKTAPPKKRGRPSFIADQASASEDDDNDDDEEEHQNQYESDDDGLIHSAASLSESDDAAPANAHSSKQDPPPTIPPALLTSLLHHHFKDDKIRIGKDANGVVGKYMETFVREAIARAAFERSEAAVKEKVGGAGGAGVFLEVSGLLMRSALIHQGGKGDTDVDILG